MYRARRPATVLALVALAGGGAADAAHAGTASGRPAQFTAGPGESNDVIVDAGSGAAVQFTDAAELIVPALPWCTPFPLGQALCDPDGDPRDTDGGGVGVDLGDRDDRAVIRWVPGTGFRPGRITVTAGAGDDHVESSAKGSIRFDGGDGDDRLITGAAADAVLRGGGGADLIASGATCCAVVRLRRPRPHGVRVTLDETPNDGGDGEGDDVRTSGVLGSPGPDCITGDDAANVLTGSGGADELDGGDGDDSIDATLRRDDASGAADGRDAVTCGAGDDDVTADPDDTVAIDCERIRVDAAVPPGLVLDIGAARADRAGRVRLTYRLADPLPGNAVVSRSTFRFVDRRGRVVSSTARFVLGADVRVVRLKVKLSRDDAAASGAQPHGRAGAGRTAREPRRPAGRHGHEVRAAEHARDRAPRPQVLSTPHTRSSAA